MIEREGREQAVLLRAQPEDSAAEVLHTFARRAADLLLSDAVIRMHRLVASAATQSPRLGRLVYAGGSEHLISAWLAGYHPTTPGLRHANSSSSR